MKSRLDHWLRFLPEAGTVVHLAEQIEGLENELRRYTFEVKRLKRLLKRLDRTAHTRALKNWTEQEIMNAKLAQISPLGEK